MRVTLDALRVPPTKTQSGTITLVTSLTMDSGDIERPTDELVDAAVLLESMAHTAMRETLAHNKHSSKLAVTINERDPALAFGAALEIARSVTPSAGTPATRARVTAKMRAEILKQKQQALV